MDAAREFFSLNRPILLFVYGQTFFILGLAIFLQSRRHSRLRLARDLRWLAAFGVLHALYEWGDVFIPIQAIYLPPVTIGILSALRTLLLAVSFFCLLAFGARTLDERWPFVGKIAVGMLAFWVIVFFVTLALSSSAEYWNRVASIWARYLLGLPGGLLAAYGLRYQSEIVIKPLAVKPIYQMLRVAGITLAVYSVLAGVVVPAADFFPASVFNREALDALIIVPIEVFRSLAGLVLAVSMIRALEIFDIEVDRLIEDMEVDQIRAAERNRIGQEIHDGAVQSVYSANLILETLGPFLQGNEEATVGVDRAKRILSTAQNDLRRYLAALRSDAPTEPLAASLERLATDPRYSSLMRVKVKLDAQATLKPAQVAHTLAIVQESLSNAARHADAHHVTISADRNDGGVLLEIEDDGRGFDEQKITPGYGLRAIHDRARLLGGKLDIASHLGKGTTISLWIPQDNGSL